MAWTIMKSWQSLGTEKHFLSSLKHPDQFCGPASLILDETPYLVLTLRMSGDTGSAFGSALLCQYT